LKTKHSKTTLLLVDDDQLVRETTAQWLRLSDYEVQEFDNAQTLLAEFDVNRNAIVISDIRMQPLDGLGLMSQLLALAPRLPVILITGHGDIDMAVKALRDGAFDFLEKPFDPNRLLETVAKACAQRELDAQQRQQQDYLANVKGIEELILGKSVEIQAIREQIKTFAQIDTNVIIYGDTGCGKELVAQALHEHSHRRDKPFMAINCAAIPADLFESELFGHEAGAFTSAQKQRIGKLELASGGSLFLDEIESMPLAMQIKLLRVLQENTLERVGGNKSIKVDLRVLAAAKGNLQTQEAFRQDLFFRLNVSQVHLPPLNERGDDIPLLFEHFCQQACAEKGANFRPLSPMDHETLMLYGWPGNVRELRNVALRYALEANSTIVKILSGYQAQSSHVNLSPLPLSVKVQEYERNLIDQALRDFKGNIQSTLDFLHLPRRTLNQKMQRYGLNRSDYLDES